MSSCKRKYKLQPVSRPTKSLSLCNLVIEYSDYKRSMFLENLKFLVGGTSISGAGGGQYHHLKVLTTVWD